MTLIITAIAAIVFTVLRFTRPVEAHRLHFGAAALMFWGATIMWCMDGIACVMEGEPFIELSDAAAMADDALLGACVVILGLVVWGVVNVVKRGANSTAKAIS